MRSSASEGEGTLALQARTHSRQCRCPKVSAQWRNTSRDGTHEYLVITQRYGLFDLLVHPSVHACVTMQTLGSPGCVSLICYRNYELYVKDVELAADVQAGVFGTGRKSFVV